MIELNKLCKIGLGTYRMTLENKDHMSSLRYCIEKGVNLIDTASNYQFGNSEKLIGSILNNENREKLFIVTKAGYIQKADISTLPRKVQNEGVAKINDNFYYSFSKSFLETQVQESLKRLKTDYLDGFLVHNPEHYLKNSNVEESVFYNQLSESLYYLEELVEKGILRYYGVSSNVAPTNEVSIPRILENNKGLKSFKLVQFPYNLVENQAEQKFLGNVSLIDYCKTHGLSMFINRPLNTTVDGNVVRIADYSSETSKIDFEKEKELFEDLLTAIDERLEHLGEKSSALEFRTIKFLAENRKKIANPEAVMKIVSGHLIPFIEQLQFPTNRVEVLINELTKYWVLSSKVLITNRALKLKSSLVEKGEINEKDSRDISLIACENYLNKGIDHVLVGMRKKEYVDRLLNLI